MTSLKPDQYVLGIDIGGTNLRLALADSSAAILHTWSTNLRQTPDPGSVIALVLEGARVLLQQAGLSQAALIACAAGAPGITDTDRGVVLATSYLLGWTDVPLQKLLEEALQLPAAIDNDVNLAALGEYCSTWNNAPGDKARSFVFLAVGTGIGAGIVLNGRLHRGETFSAGEIGYMLVPGVSEVPAGEDQPGALESRVGGTGMREQWQALWDPKRTSLGKEASPTEILSEAAGILNAAPGHWPAVELLESSARILAYAIYNMALVLNCTRFVLGGGVGTHPAFVAAVQRHVDARHPYAPIQISASALGAGAQLAGAVQLALERGRSTRPAADCSTWNKG